MAQHIVLLRGINVSGKNIVKMADLRIALSGAGLEDVKTYIQSGNITCSSSLSKKSVAQIVKDAVDEICGNDVPVLALSKTELAKILANNPFSEEEPKSLYVTLLASKPKKDGVEKLEAVDKKNDEFVVDGKTVFICCRTGYGQTKLTNKLFETKLGVAATSRNWRTMNKLQEMIDG